MRLAGQGFSTRESEAASDTQLCLLDREEGLAQGEPDEALSANSAVFMRCCTLRTSPLASSRGQRSARTGEHCKLQAAAEPPAVSSGCAARHRADNIFRWKCQIPGKEGTDWAGGYFPLTIEFSEGAALLLRPAPLPWAPC